MAKKKKKHIGPDTHILADNGELVALVVTVEFSDRNVFKPEYFHSNAIYYGPLIGEWLRPIVMDLFEKNKPLFLLNHLGKEFEVVKEESLETFLL